MLIGRAADGSNYNVSAAVDTAKAVQQQQEAAMKRQQEETKAFYDTMYKDISGLTNIRGINIPKEDRKQLFEYIFK